MAAAIESPLAAEERHFRESGALQLVPTLRETIQVVLATIAAAFGLALLTTWIVIPTIFGDELRYWEAARSVAGGDGLSIRGGTYGYGPLYPVILSPLLDLLSPSDAYFFAKLLNAALFAGAAIPLYVIARRVLDHRHSLAVALLSICVPASIYTGFILTESTAYFAAAAALLAMVSVLERPSVRRQLTALGSVALATAARPQLVVLGGALILGYCLQAVMKPRDERRGFIRSLWPTLVLVLAGGGVVVVKVATEGGAALGGYSDLASTDYSVLAGIVWTWWTVGALALSLAAVPALLFPSIVRDLWRNPSKRSASDSAFLAMLVSVTAALVVSVGFFSSTTESLEIIHERYFFYAAPLWLMGIAVWAQRGARVTRGEFAIGAVLAVLLVATLPPGIRKINSTVWFEWPSGAPWVLSDSVVPIGGMAFSTAFALAIVTVSAVCLRAARRRAALAFVPIAVAFAAAVTVGWTYRSVIVDIDRTWYGSAFHAKWVDAVVGSDAQVVSFFPGSERCSDLMWQRPMLYTEWDNAAIGRAVHLRVASAPVIESTGAMVDHDGFVVDGERRRILAKLVLAPRGTPVVGRELASGYQGRVTLWSVDGAIRIAGASSTRAVLRTACR